MNKKIIIGASIGLAVLILILTNPNQSAHKDAVKLKFNAFMQKKMDEKTRLNIQLGNQLIEKQAADISLGASLMGKTLSEVMSDPSLLPSAVALGQKAKLAEFSEKEGVKLQNRLAAKNDAVHGGFGKFTDSDTVTYTDEKGDPIYGMVPTPYQWYDADPGNKGNVKTVRHIMDHESKIISNPFKRSDDTEVTIFFKLNRIYVYVPKGYTLLDFNIVYLIF